MSDLAETARLRQGLYRFFGGALSPPGETRFEPLTAAAVYLEGLGIEAYAFYPSWHALLERLTDLEEPSVLEAEYVRLFASGTDDALCPPTESYYRARAEGGGIAHVMAELGREYRSLGMSVAGAPEGPDHAVTELEVLSSLCATEAHAWETMDVVGAGSVLTDEEGFLKRHLAIWFPTFRGRVRTAARIDFYRTLVEAVHAYVVHDVDHLFITRRYFGNVT